MSNSDEPNWLGTPPEEIARQRAAQYADLERRFSKFPPPGDESPRYRNLCEEAMQFAVMIVQATPPGREQALALTNLEQSLMWASLAIVREPKA